MQTGSLNTKRHHSVTLSIVTLLIAGCTTSQPAPISAIGTDNTSTTRAPQVVSQPATPQVQALPRQQPLQTEPIQQQPVTTSSQRVTPAPQPDNVQMRDGFIVYNRQYDSIPKGSYTNSPTYKVKHGDTLFYIAWITGNDYRDLAKRNNIPQPYSLKPGQILQVENASGAPLTGENSISRADASAQQKPAPAVTPEPVITYSGSSVKQNDKKMLPKNPPAAQPVSGKETATVQGLSWRWPANGNIIENFSSTQGGSKGMDIAGKKGQPILAAAAGRVVYAGNALRGYGNLIIIKHNDDYLSAYAHNDTMLVQEQQEIRAGQQIATMGSTGTSSTRLHFEVRYKGKPVNPLRYLPQR